MKIKTFVFKDLAIQSNLVIDEKNHLCALIDPPRIIAPLTRYIEENQLRLEAVLESHVHADFISGAKELKAYFNGHPKIYCSAAGGEEWLAKYTDESVKDGSIVSMGEIFFKALHTPGHTPEHITWLCFDKSIDADIPQAAFTGDFIFVQGVGRPDLLGKEKETHLMTQLYHSLFVKAASLPDTLAIYPSHGAGSMCGKGMANRLNSTLLEERQTNEAFQKEEISLWSQKILAGMPSPPKSFYRNKRINVVGAPLLSTLPEVTFSKEIKDIEAFIAKGLIIDFRSPKHFGRSHIRSAINIPLTDAFGNWLAAILVENAPILCVMENLKEFERVVNVIRLLGYDQPIELMVFEENKIPNQHLSKLEEVSAIELKSKLKAENNYWIIDVRTPTEWISGHIKEAHHIEMNQLEARLEEIPKDKHIITLCGSGWRSSIAASLLKRHGFNSTSHLAGGMGAWSSS